MFALALHPTLNVMATGGRDSTVRLWDMRTKAEVQCLSGHRDIVECILMQNDEP